MNIGILYEIAGAWRMATGYPPPLVKKKNINISERYLVFFPFIGLITGILFYVIDKSLEFFSIKETVAGINAIRALLIVFLGVAISHGNALVGFSKLLGKRYPVCDKKLFTFQNGTTFTVITLLLLLLHFFSASQLIAHSHTKWLIVVYTFSFCMRLELGNSPCEQCGTFFSSLPDIKNKATNMEYLLAFILFIFSGYPLPTLCSFLLLIFGLRVLLKKMDMQGKVLTEEAYQTYSYVWEFSLLLAGALLLS